MVKWNVEKCLRCGSCASVCPVYAIEFVNNEIKIDNNKCIKCEICIKSCPTKALEKDW